MESGIEYLIEPAGSSTEPDIPPVAGEASDDWWADTRIGIPEPKKLYGFTVKARYYETDDLTPEPTPDNPDPEPVVSRTYPGFELISQKLEVGDYFVEDPTGLDYPLEPTYAADPGVYAMNAYAVAGITDGAAYQYSKVFDQTIFRLIPADYQVPLYPPRDSGDIRVDNIPEEPFDPDNNIFPYKTITHYEPDTRTNVLVTYKLTTQLCGAFGGTCHTEEINIYQWVTQTIYDWGPACRYYACKGEYPYTASAENYCPVGPFNTNEYPQ